MIAGSVAAALGKAGTTVTAIDLTGQDSLKLWLGVRPGQPVFGQDRYTKDAMLSGGVRPISISKEKYRAADCLSIVTAASGVTELVIVDIASADEDTWRMLQPHAALSLCVLAADAGSVAVLPRALALAPADDKQLLFVVNQIDLRGRFNSDAAKLFERALGHRLVATIRRDEAVNEALASLEPLNVFAPKSAAASDIQDLSEVLSSILPRLLTDQSEVAAQ
jgi:cellulose biosynthesis protein BcsQ